MLSAKEEIVSMIYQLPEQQLEKIFNLIRLFKDEKHYGCRKYDFSDLAGKLKWKGDAVVEQRRIRDHCLQCMAIVWFRS